MAKPKRGRHVKLIPGWRGTCPTCNRTGVKLLWTNTGENNEKQNVCKRCGK